MEISHKRRLHTFLHYSMISILVFLVVLGLQRSGLLQKLELLVFDQFIGPRPDAADSRLVIIGINENDIHNPITGGWPITDGKLAQMLTILEEHEPAAIGIDLYRDLPVPSDGSELEQLNSVLHAHANIVGIIKAGGGDSVKIAVAPALQDSPDRVGFNDFPIDFDKLVRRALLFMDDDDGTTYYSLALQLALKYLEPKDISLAQPDPAEPDRIQLGLGLLQPFETDDGGYVDEDARGYSFLMDFRGPEHYETYSLTDLLSAKISADAVKGKVVLIGAMAESLKDYYPTPLNYRQYGVGLHASVVNQLLRFALDSEQAIRVWTEVQEYCWIFLWVVIGILMGRLSRTPLRLVIPSILLLGLLFFTAHFAFNRSLWIISVAPAVAWALSAFATVIYMVVIGGKQEKLLKNMFSTMVSPEILQYMLDRPDRFSLSGEKKEATMFFSDLAGFTTISESVSAEQLATILNEYLTPMSNVILGYGGYIDKYEGDAIMADFGVPVWEENDPHSHAWKCCWSALDQQEELRPLRKAIKDRLGVELHARMGINTGAISAGNMGSEQKFQYTVMGDAVNQAARFEAANKLFGTYVMIGESTYLLAKDKIEVRFLALLQVKGKTHPVKVYELVAKKGELNADQRKLIPLFEEGWKVYADKEFEKGITVFDQCLAIDAHDPPSIIYRDKCQQYLKNPPPADWHGDWVQ